MTSPQVASGRILPLDGWRRVAFHVAVCLFSSGVTIARRPDAVFNAQFYAEDGRRWFADAYNYGWWRALLSSYGGYFHVIPRAAGAIALLVPVVHAALIENLVAIAIQAIPVNLLLASRSAPWGSFRFRAVLAGLYLFLPNTRELVGTVTNSQWILGLIALLLVVALPPQSKVARASELGAFVVCGLTGPFYVFLFPIAVFVLWSKRRDFRARVTLGVFAVCCTVQGISLLLNNSARPRPVLGASLEWFARLLAGEVYLGTILGANELSLRLSAEVLGCIAVVGTVILILCAISAPVAMRCFLLYSCVLFVAALISPETFPAPGGAAWRMLAVCGGARYWFPLSLAFAWSLAYCARGSSRVIRGAALCLLVMMSVGFVRDFRYPPFEDLSHEFTKRLEQTPPGTSVALPINPTGWDMRIVKH
jgi:hypothetical protein